MRTLSILLIFFSFPVVLSGEQEGKKISLYSKGAILINGKTGAILFEKNADKTFYPASITKIATAYYVLKKKALLLDSPIKASQNAIGAVSSQDKKDSQYALSPHWIEFGSSHIGIKRGEILSLRTLLYGLLLASGNDAANVLAEYVSGSIPQFMKELNRELQEMGCTGTHFLNPHGLHHPDHVTTPQDMAKITQRAFENPIFREIVRKTRYKRERTNKQAESFFTSGNRLLLPHSSLFYSHALGIKTGYTSEAQRTFVAAAEKEGRLLICVLFSSERIEEKYLDARKLFDHFFAETLHDREVVSDRESFYFSLPHAPGVSIEARPERSFILSYYPSESPPSVYVRISWKGDLALPISCNQEVGTLILSYSEGTFLVEKKIPLRAIRDVIPLLKKIEEAFKLKSVQFFAILFSFFLLFSLYQVRRLFQLRK